VGAGIRTTQETGVAGGQRGGVTQKENGVGGPVYARSHGNHRKELQVYVWNDPDGLVLQSLKKTHEKKGRGV